jgi:all-trans-retinol 13,14-reductase
MDCGGYYPVGGASEIAFNMIPIIEQSGGKVLVRADVTQILCNKENKAHGIVVKKGSEEYNFFAPLIISNAGAYNTFQTLLPKEIAVKSYYHSLLKGTVKLYTIHNPQ